MRLPASLFVPGFALLVSACATSSSFTEPDTDVGAAQLTLQSSTSGIAASSWVDVYTTEKCVPKDGEGRMATFNLVTKGSKLSRLPTGNRLYILAGAEIEPPVGAEVRMTTSCRAMVSFVPEVGKSYELHHDLASRNCPLTIKEAGGAEVATAEKHRVSGECRGKK